MDQSVSLNRGELFRDESLQRYVSAIASGDPSAMAALYDETSGLVYTLALRVLGDEADAEEVTLDVYSQVWRSAATFSAGRGSVAAWLTSIARSRAIDRLRSRRKNEAEESIESAEQHASGESTPEERTIEGERRALVRRALQAIPSEQRKLLELAYFEGLSQSELAARTGQPLGTIKTRMRLGMMKLREQLAGRMLRAGQN